MANSIKMKKNLSSIEPENVHNVKFTIHKTLLEG